jgi:hypothetical protein
VIDEQPTVACYVHWRDAAMDMTDTPIEDMSLVDLYEIGWLVKETDDYITLAMEYPALCIAEKGKLSTRLALTIPKSNIVFRHEFGLPKRRASKPRQPRKRKPQLEDTALTAQIEQEKTEDA